MAGLLGSETMPATENRMVFLLLCHAMLPTVLSAEGLGQTGCRHTLRDASSISYRQPVGGIGRWSFLPWEWKHVRSGDRKQSSVPEFSHITAFPIAYQAFSTKRLLFSSRLKPVDKGKGVPFLLKQKNSASQRNFMDSGRNNSWRWFPDLLRSILGSFQCPDRELSPNSASTFAEQVYCCAGAE